MTDHHHPRLHGPPKLPIPDMRLESTFLRNIRSFVHTTDAGTRIEWGKVAWVAIRDTVLSPLLFGTASALVQPLWQKLAASFSGTAGLARRPAREGGGVSALRQWLGGITGSVDVARA